MMSALGELGRVGFVAVGESPQAARTLYDHTLAILSEEAAQALRSQPVA
jgi:hypothetical protein